MYKRRWLKNADLIFIRRSYLPRIRATVQTTNSDVIVHSSGNDLHSFEIVSQDHNVTASCIRLDGGMEQLPINY